MQKKITEKRKPQFSRPRNSGIGQAFPSSRSTKTLKIVWVIFFYHYLNKRRRIRGWATVKSASHGRLEGREGRLCSTTSAFWGRQSRWCRSSSRRWWRSTCRRISCSWRRRRRRWRHCILWWKVRSILDRWRWGWRWGGLGQGLFLSNHQLKLIMLQLELWDITSVHKPVAGT